METNLDDSKLFDTLKTLFSAVILYFHNLIYSGSCLPLSCRKPTENYLKTKVSIN